MNNMTDDQPQFDNPTEWSTYSLDLREKEEQNSDIKLAKRDGYNLRNYRMNIVWKVLEYLYREGKEETFTIEDIYAKIDEMFITEKWKSVDVDRTTLCHYVGRLWALGLLGRIRGDKGRGRDIKYYFKKIIREKGIEWFLTNNEYMTRPSSEGGLFDDLLEGNLKI